MQLELNDPECVVSPPSPPRHEVWIRARQDEKGAYLSEETAKIATVISQYAEEHTRGEFVVQGRADILAAALPNPEHPGRVRGEQGKVGWKDYFAPTKCSDATISKKEFEGLNNKLKQMEAEREIEREKYTSDLESVRAEMRAELKARDDVLMKLLGQMNGTLQKDDQHVQTSVGHNVHIPISKPIIPLQNMPPILLSPQKKMKLTQLDDKMKSLPSDPMVVRSQSSKIPREKILVLYDRFELRDKKTYRFLDPGEISSKHHNGKSIVEINNNRIRYIENAVKDESVECWLAPYNAGSDWMLCAIIPSHAIVFCFDLVQDAGCRRKADIKHIINSAFFNLKYQGKSHYVQPGKVHPKWIDVKCCVQDKQVEGGYFVMKMMYDIMVRPTLPCIDEIYGNEASPFQMKDINEMKSLFYAHFNSKYDELIGYSQEHVISVFGQVKDNAK